MLPEAIHSWRTEDVARKPQSHYSTTSKISFKERGGYNSKIFRLEISEKDILLMTAKKSGNHFYSFGDTEGCYLY